ncbi:MAG: hypothetical protein R2682_14700 [Pyrinomonadaceae bacterium]
MKYFTEDGPFVRIVILVMILGTLAAGCDSSKAGRRSAEIEPTAVRPAPATVETPLRMAEIIKKNSGWFRLVRGSYTAQPIGTSGDDPDRITTSKLTPKAEVHAALACPLDVDPSFLKLCERPQIFGPNVLVAEITVLEVDNTPFSLLLNLTQDTPAAAGAITLVRIRDEDGDGIFESLYASAFDEHLDLPKWVEKRIASMKE